MSNITPEEVADLKFLMKNIKGRSAGATTISLVQMFEKTVPKLIEFYEMHTGGPKDFLEVLRERGASHHLQEHKVMKATGEDLLKLSEPFDIQIDENIPEGEIQQIMPDGTRKVIAKNIGKKMTKEQKEWIDSATYYELLERWRFSKTGDALFRDEAGYYFGKVMAEKKASVDHVAISKQIGWAKP